MRKRKLWIIPITISLCMLSACQGVKTVDAPQTAKPTPTEQASATSAVTGTATAADTATAPASTSVPGTVKDPTPLVVGTFLLGGLQAGVAYAPEEWMNADLVQMKDFAYDVYDFQGKLLGKAKGSALLNRYDSTDEWAKGKAVEDFFPYSLIKLTGDTELPDETIAIHAAWNPFPRKAQDVGDTKQYEAVIKSILAEKGITDVTYDITAIEVDLNNDGTMETLVAAQNQPTDDDEDSLSVHKGNYSMALLITGTGSGQKVQVIDSFIVDQEPKEITPYRMFYNIASVMDVDGDGILEVIVYAYYYEGDGYKVYKLESNELHVTKLSNDFGH